MNETSSKQFGLIVAYLLPGFIALAGIAPLARTVRDWLRPTIQGDLGIGSTAYAVMAALTAGMIASCFRWLLIDHVHHWTGLPRPPLDSSPLAENLGAFNYLVESHYRYYQFYGNTLVAMVWTYSIHRWLRTSPLLGFGTDRGILILCAVLFAGSRDALTKYRYRSRQLVG
jgi:hypothetical protein